MARRRGRRVAIGAWYAILVAFIVAAVVQITRQVFAPTGASLGPKPACHEGLLGLARALDAARAAADGVASGNEDEVLARYRGVLETPWSARDAIAESCRADRASTESLDAIERLRYAEEHALRREAAELTPLRLRIHALERDLDTSPRTR